jgi:diacylglycerol kinase family enzyme
MRALLVVNPKATTTSSRVRDVLAHALASETKLDVVQTQSRGHAAELASQAALDGLDVVVALGGDGTVNEVVNGLLADGPRSGLPALAVVPAGSANVFARALGLSPEPVEATGQLLDALRADRRRTIGLGQADERWFTFCAGLGIDAQVVRRVEHKRAVGRRATPGLYVRTGVAQFFRSDRRSAPITLETPGAAPQRMALALVCNSDPWTFLGSRPVRPCPQASLETGLDLFGLTRLGTLTTLRHLRQILAAEPRPRGRRVRLEHDLPRFTLSADRALAFQVDGDDLGDRTRVEFRAVPYALDVVV